MTNDEVILKRLEEMVVLASEGRLGDYQRMTVLGIPERFRELMAIASARPEAAVNIPEGHRQVIRNAALEEAADLADQKLDVYSGTDCTYRGDVAEAIRELKDKPSPQRSSE